MMKSRSLALVATLLVSLAACDDDPSGPDNDRTAGTFEASVTGSLTANLDGDAYLSRVQEDGENRQVITLSDLDIANNRGQFIALFSANNQQFQKGTTTLTNAATLLSNDSPVEGAAALYLTLSGGGDEPRFFVSTGGTLTITQVNGDELAGTVTFNASEILENESGNTTIGSARVRVTSEFKTRSCPEGNEGCLPFVSRSVVVPLLR